MRSINVLLGVLVLAAALLGAAPAALASVVAGAAGVLMMASASLTTAPQVPVSAPVQIARQVEVPAAVKVFELEGGAGVVVFRQVNGKMVSRFYRAQA
ncbi:MAG: hypothetical protein K6U78_04065 [Anaerolineae bacterium]|jgi:hypothetical protein|nr:hypothetical protein [Anaerolineae bacterium]